VARQGAQRDKSKEQFWRGLLRQWRCSGLSIRAFCAEHGVSEPSFYSWRRVLAQRDRRNTGRGQARHGAGSGDPPRFVPLHVVPAALGMTFEVVLSQGRILRVPAPFDAATLRQLLAILEEERPC
jgi:transposase-like protein